MLCAGLILVMWCDAATPIRAPSVRCPPLPAYAAEMQKDAARELRGLPAGSTTRRLVSDYGTLRARCRASEGR